MVAPTAIGGDGGGSTGAAAGGEEGGVHATRMQVENETLAFAFSH